MIAEAQSTGAPSRVEREVSEPIRIDSQLNEDSPNAKRPTGRTAHASVRELYGKLGVLRDLDPATARLRRNYEKFQKSLEIRGLTRKLEIPKILTEEEITTATSEDLLADKTNFEDYAALLRDANLLLKKLGDPTLESATEETGLLAKLHEYEALFGLTDKPAYDPSNPETRTSGDIFEERLEIANKQIARINFVLEKRMAKPEAAIPAAKHKEEENDPNLLPMDERGNVLKKMTAAETIAMELEKYRAVSTNPDALKILASLKGKLGTAHNEGVIKAVLVDAATSFKALGLGAEEQKAFATDLKALRSIGAGGETKK